MMNEVLHANIFFLITSIAVIVATLLICIALYHGIKILQAIRRIVERVDASSEMIVEDVEQLRSYVLGGGMIAQVLSFFKGRRSRKAGRTARGTTVNVTDED